VLTTACSMLIVPILVPVPVAMVVVAGVAGEVAGVVAEPAGAAAAVWAHAELMTMEMVDRTAVVRRERRNLLVIGSVKLLEMCSRIILFSNAGPD
jgi:hypothetical protein